MSNGESRGNGKLIFGVVLVVLVAGFALLNWDDVEINFLFVKIDAPLFFVIVGSAIFGIIAGAVMRMGRD